MAGLELWWLGQAGFRLRDPAGGATIYCDPFITPSDRRSWQAPITPETLAEADLVVVSHEHTDHLDRPALQAAAATPGSRFTLVVPRPLVADLTTELGLPAERIVGAQPDEPIARSGVRISPVPACHGINVADAYTFGEDLPGSNGMVRYLGYVVELGGVRAYHAGDCIPYPGQVERLRALQPHLALLPINGRDVFRESERNIVGNMDYREAARVASESGVHLLVPMHWEMFAHNRGFPEHLVGFVADNFPELSVLVMGRGTTFTYAAPSHP
jgi:L-ascorbate metabolism protein UlaG (beta-lactamase superfamily)